MSGLAAIELEYNWENKAQHEKLKLVAPWLYEEKDGETKPVSSWSVGEKILSSVEIEQLTECGVELKLKRFKGVIPAIPGEKIPPNSHVQIHLPNYVLNNYNSVMVEEDCCTDKLQQRLDEGWRIIAVCPPLNARRPDYVLAKHDGDYER